MEIFLEEKLSITENKMVFFFIITIKIIEI